MYLEQSHVEDGVADQLSQAMEGGETSSPHLEQEGREGEKEGRGSAVHSRYFEFACPHALYQLLCRLGHQASPVVQPQSHSPSVSDQMYILEDSAPAVTIHQPST